MNHLPPMLASPLKGTANPKWHAEPKYDGHRVVVEKTNGELSIYSRTFHEQLGKLPHLEQAFMNVDFDFTLDGEIVAIQSFAQVGGKEVAIVDFSGTQSVMGSGIDKAVANQKREGDLTFIVFDCLNVYGEDVTMKPDTIRRGYAELMVDLISTWTPNIMLTPRWTRFDSELYEELVAAGCEGVMLKNPLGGYRPGKRSRDWLKMKSVSSADVVIMGYEPGKDGFSGMVGAVRFGQYVNGKLVERSQCSGMDMKMRMEFTQNPQKYIDRVMEITYMTRVGPKRSFRHPNFKTLRTDKRPEECVWDD